MKKSLLALATVLAIVAGCAKEKLGTSLRTHSGIKVITATIPDQTKTYFNSEVYKLFWNEDEQIKAGVGEEFVDFFLTSEPNQPKGIFESEIDLPESDYYFLISPSEVLKKSVDDSLFVTYPSVLTYDETSGNVLGGEIMAAKSDGPNFTIHNAIGYIKFELAVTEEDQITEIDISGKDGKSIAGDAKIVFDGTQIDTVRFLSGAENSVTVKFSKERTVTPSENFITYIPVAPMAKGVTITVVMKSGKAMSMSTTDETSVNIGQILELPAITFAPVTVAKIGETEYYSIDQALRAAGDASEDVTISLIRDCVVGANCEVLNTNYVITLDLAGHTLYSAGSKFFTVAKDTKECVIMDSSEPSTGKITNTNPSNAALKTYGRTRLVSGTCYSPNNYGFYVVGGTLIVEGGTIDGGGDGLYVRRDSDNAVDSVVVYEGANILSSSAHAVVFNALNGQFIVRGGHFYSQTACIYLYDGKMEIYDGDFGCKSNVIYANRSTSYANDTDIYGGFFHKDTISDASIVYGHSAIKDSTIVWGGYYSISPSTNYVADGYEISACDTTYKEVKYTATVIKSAEYVAELRLGSGAPILKATINEAFDAIKAQTEPATVTLLADCSMKDSIGLWAGNVATLDLNGHTLTTPGTKVFRVNETGAILTIKSSVEGGMMFESAGGSNSLIVRGGGKCILESGIIKGNNNDAGHVYVQTNELGVGEFIQNGGIIWTPDYNAVSCPSGKFVMNGGVIRTDKSGTYPIRVTGGTAEFNGGSFVSTSDEYKIYSSGSAVVTINGEFDNLATSGSGAYTITGGTYTGAYRSNATNLTINGGTFTNDAGQALAITAGGIATINGGTFTGTSEYGTIRSYGSTTINEGATVVSNGENFALYLGSDATSGQLVINGGTFTGYNTVRGQNGTLSITGGIFNSSKSAIYVKSTCAAEISGGYFNTPKIDSTIFYGSGSKGITKAGWFTYPLADSLINGAYTLDDSKTTVVSGVTYSYHVVENLSAPDIVSVNGTNYKTVDAAIEAAHTAMATGDVTFKILENCETLSSLSPDGDNNFTIDLNGKSFTAQVTSTVKTLNITDNSAEANGTFTGKSGLSAIWVKEGTINFDKGNIFGDKIPGVMIEGTKDNKVTFNMTGGNITSTDPCDDWATKNQGAVSVIDNAEFNLSGGFVVDTVGADGRAINCRHMGKKSDASFAPTVNISDGTVIGYKYTLGGYYGSHYYVTGGNIVALVNAPVYSGSGSTDQLYDITGGYFVTNYSDGRVYSGYLESMTKIKGGYYNVATPKLKPSSVSAKTITPEVGYSIQEVSPAEVKVIDGVEYSFVSKVAADK